MKTKADIIQYLQEVSLVCEIYSPSLSLGGDFPECFVRADCMRLFVGMATCSYDSYSELNGSYNNKREK